MLHDIIFSQQPFYYKECINKINFKLNQSIECRCININLKQPQESHRKKVDVLTKSTSSYIKTEL